MNSDIIKKIMVERMARKGIADIKRDPQRSIRNLVDLGEHFCKSRFQRTFFQLTQTMLAEQESPYYTLIERLVNDVAPETLETFGVNIAYMSWTCGARTIRKKEAENGYNIPWVLYLDYDFDCDEPLDLSSIVEQGKQLGIYTFILFVGSRTNNIEQILETCKKYSDRAFMIFSNAAETTEFLVQDPDPSKNILLSIAYGQQDLAENVQLLLSRQRLYGFHVYYGVETVPDILSGRLIEDMIEADGRVQFFLPGKECNIESRQQVAAFAKQRRLEQTYPAFLLELYADTDYADKIISVESCMAGIRADGTVFTVDGIARPQNAKDDTLESILSKAMPRVGYTEK